MAPQPQLSYSCVPVVLWKALGKLYYIGFIIQAELPALTLQILTHLVRGGAQEYVFLKRSQVMCCCWSEGATL